MGNDHAPSNGLRNRFLHQACKALMQGHVVSHTHTQNMGVCRKKLPRILKRGLPNPDTRGNLSQ